MTKNKATALDNYIEQVESFAVYVDKKNKIVGIYNTLNDCTIAETSYALKRLKNLYKFRIQMVSKELHV